jgi:hypothetical protein
MKRRALAGERRADARAGDEVRLRFDGRRPRALRQVHERADAAERIGERHQRAAVHGFAGRAQIGPHLHRRDDALGRRFDERDAHQPGEQVLQHALDRFEVGHGGSLSGLMRERSPATQRTWAQCLRVASQIAIVDAIAMISNAHSSAW